MSEMKMAKSESRESRSQLPPNSVSSFVALRTLGVCLAMLVGVCSGYMLCAALAAFTVTLLLYYIHSKYSYWATLGVPSPPATVLLGHTLKRMGVTMPFMEFFDELYHNYNGRDFCGFYEFLKPGLFVGNPELIKSILVKDFDHFTDRRTFDLGKVNPIANDMLTNATGAHWRMIRSVVSPAFTARKTRRLHPLVVQRAAHLLKLASTEAEKGPIEARSLCGRYTMDTIASCAFGIECEAMSSEATAFPEMAARIFQLSPVRAIKIMILLVAPKLAEVVQRLGIDFTSAEFHFFREVVTHTLRMREESTSLRGDFLDLLMETRLKGKEGLSDNTVTAQAILFLLAGYDNTANTLAMALHLLAHNPRALAVLRRELALATLRCNDAVTYDCLMELPYLDAIINETLRLYPAAPVIERICTRQYSIGGSHVQLERGQPVIIPVWSVHRDSRHWNEPLVFRPERFIGNKKAAITPYSYLPFGQGPRSCIGLRFAMLSIKVGLASLLTHMSVEPCPLSTYPVPLDSGVLTLQPKTGVYVNLQPLKSSLMTIVEEEMSLYPSQDTDDEIVMMELRQHRHKTPTVK